MRGGVRRLDLPGGRYHSPRFSPDGKQIALYTSDGFILIHDLSGTKQTRKLTPQAGNLMPLWTRDGRVVFRSARGVQASLFWQPGDASAVAEQLTKAGERSYLPYSVSSDGKSLVVVSERTEVVPEIFTLPLNGDGAPRTLFQGAKGDTLFSPVVSPDGRWLAYERRTDNKNNIYVDPLPPTGVHHPVTTEGGSAPIWSRDGKRLFYLRPSAPATERTSVTFYSVEVFGTGASFENGKPTAMFSVDGLYFAGSGPGNVVDLSPDGKQFVTVLLPPEADGDLEQGSVSVVLNWQEELKRLVPIR
jgi:Tol biopolymer transport system component